MITRMNQTIPNSHRKHQMRMITGTRTGRRRPDEDLHCYPGTGRARRLTATPAPTESPEEPVEDNYPKIATDPYRWGDGQCFLPYLLHPGNRPLWKQSGRSCPYGNRKWGTAFLPGRTGCWNPGISPGTGRRCQHHRNQGDRRRSYATTLPPFTLYKGEDAGPQVQSITSQH